MESGAAEDDKGANGLGAPTPVPNLALAIRRARVETAQHSEALAEIRGGETARLEMIGEALTPVLAQVPATIDLFDTGLAPGEKPRYFVDMLGFVEMARDRRTFRFLQDTRHGRVTVMESDKPEDIVEAVTAYIARRLVEREQALASDQTIEQAARALIARGMPETTPSSTTELGDSAAAANENAAAAPALAELAATPAPRRRRGFFTAALVFVVEFLGSIALCLLLMALGYFAWTAGGHQWALRFGG